MKGGRFLFAGGVLFFVTGVILLVNSIIVLPTLDPFPSHESPLWYDIVNTFGYNAFKNFAVIFPVILILTGIIGMIRFWFVANVAMNLVTWSIILLAGIVGRRRIFLVPFYENLGEWFGFSARFTSWAYWISIMILAAILQVFLYGVEVGANDGHDKFTITRALTRTLYLLVFLPLCYVFDWVAIPENMPTFVFIFYVLLFIPIFKTIRGYSGENSGKMILLSFAAALALPFYSVVIFMFSKFIVDIYYLIVYFPLAAIVIVFTLLSKVEKPVPMSREEKAKLDRERIRQAKEEYAWGFVRYAGWQTLYSEKSNFGTDIMNRPVKKD